MVTSKPPADGGDERSGAGQLSPAEREAFRQRADALGQKLNDAKDKSTVLPKAARPGDGEAQAANNDALGKALRISTELIGGVVVGSGIGWALDRAFGTWPAMFIVFFLVGSAAGMVNVVRAGTAMKSGPANAKAAPSVRDDDETV
jgi:ATP synthase protein I